MTDSTEYRIDKALALAPAIPSLMIMVLLLFSGADYNYIWFIAVITCWIASYLSTILIGWPIFNVLKRIDQLSLCTLSFIGMLIGALIFTLLMSLFGAYDFPLTLLWGAGFGLFISLPFGLIAGVKGFKH